MIKKKEHQLGHGHIQPIQTNHTQHVPKDGAIKNFINQYIEMNAVSNSSKVSSMLMWFLVYMKTCCCVSCDILYTSEHTEIDLVKPERTLM